MAIIPEIPVSEEATDVASTEKMSEPQSTASGKSAAKKVSSASVISAKKPEELKKQREEQIITLANSTDKLKAVKPHLVKFAPQIAQILIFLELTALPAGILAYEKLELGWKILKPHVTGDNFQDLIPTICGFCLCFFGGTFPLVIASVEAFRLVGLNGMINVFDFSGAHSGTGPSFGIGVGGTGQIQTQATSYSAFSRDSPRDTRQSGAVSGQVSRNQSGVISSQGDLSRQQTKSSDVVSDSAKSDSKSSGTSVIDKIVENADKLVESIGMAPSGPALPTILTTNVESKFVESKHESVESDKSKNESDESKSDSLFGVLDNMASTNLLNGSNTSSGNTSQQALSHGNSNTLSTQTSTTKTPLQSGIVTALSNLYTEATSAYEELEKDEKADYNGDGKPDVQSMSAPEKATHKFLVLAKTVNPDKITSAIACLNCGLLAVLASLKIGFARAVTLGAVLGDALKKKVDKFLVPSMIEVLPKELHKWVPAVVDYACKLAAISIAFTLQTLISAFHSAIRGGRMIGNYGVIYLHRKGHLKDFDAEKSNLDEAVGYGFALIGFLFQLYMGFGLVFPFNLVFLPVSICEGLLTVLISWV